MRWLHLSDFHFQALERWDRRATLNALLRYARKMKEEDRRPDFVFVTGDVAFSGKKAEYEQAERFFRQLAEDLELDLRERFFFVPGNHDVDQGVVGAADRYIVSNLKDQDAVEEIFDDEDAMALLGRRLEAFYAFTERLLGTARGWHRDRPWRVDVRRAGGVDVGVLQLNSAWVSGPADDKDLLVGEAQVREALEQSADAFLRVVLVHHPPVELREFDRDKLTPLLAASGVHFLLRGHLHSNRVEATVSPDGFLVELAAGTVYTGGRWPRAFLETEVDLAEGRARVHFLGYADKGKGFWNKDTLAYERAPDGVWTLPLPDHLKLDAEAPPPAERELTAVRRSTLTARYRSAAAAVHGTVRFVGFADHRPRPNVQVPELFVPLRLEESGHSPGDKAKSWSTSELLRHLVTAPEADAPARRAVVLGNPGTGKTTLCRFAAVVLADEAECEGVEVPGEVLPLFLPFREYVRLCREGERSLLEFLNEQARTHLQLTLPDAFLEQKLDGGGAVLLLDGLDEVGSAADREGMRERVQAFCRNYPKVPVLVTSRVAGYEDAPLRQGPDAFVHLTLSQFDNDDLRRFVSSWYAVQEANDPVERDRGAADLAAALEADERVRELARTPMLATLIALVHRFEAHLPGERAALYELCVKTLLETWPAARRKTFREIDAGLQRAYLETLAYRMQSSRSEGDKEVVIERGPLVGELAEIVRERGETSASPEETRGLVERWVRFLEEGTGILVEHRPGVFAFFHLSLMEYLAARGMEKAEDLDDAIVRRFKEATLREECLLAVGSHATEKAFLDRLFEKLKSESGSWSFLLRCLREEAAFDDGQRAEIVRGAGTDLLGKWPYDWQEDWRVLADVMRFSIRNAEWAVDWVEQEIATATGEELRGIVALRLPDDGLPGALDLRRDAARAAADLLEYWPEPQVGKWAAMTATFQDVFTWSRESPAELLVFRSLKSLIETPRLAPGLLIGRLTQARGATTLARMGRDRFDGHERPGGRGLPGSASIEPGSHVVCVSPASSVFLSEKSAPDSARYFARGFARGFVRDFAPYLTQYFGHGFAQVFGRFFARDFGQSFAQYLERDHARDFARDFGQSFARDLGQIFARDFGPYFTDSFAVAWDSETPKVIMEPKSDQELVNAKVWAELEQAKDEAKAILLVGKLTARLAGEALVALMTTAESSREERLSYVHHRVQNAWLLQVWSAVDRALPEAPHPNQTALYLTLGFTQATTTWQWPATERWIALLGGEPPDDWLPRSQWHLCWLLHDPEDAVHRRGLDDALDEGLGDAERPGVAEELRKLIPRADG